MISRISWGLSNLNEQQYFLALLRKVNSSSVGGGDGSGGDFPTYYCCFGYSSLFPAFISFEIFSSRPKRMCRSKYEDVGKQVGFLSFFGLLLTTAEGANPAAVDIEGKTPLHWTIGNTEPSCVKVLYQAYPAMVNLR